MIAQIKEYETKDMEACLNAFKSNVPLFFTTDEIVDFTVFLNTFQHKPLGNKTHFYVVVLGEEVVGCGGFGDKDQNGILTLAWGLIHNNFHKKGLGELLLKHRLEQINRLHPSKPVFIDTTQHSFGFFEKYGFEVTKITPDYYTQGMHRYDMAYQQKNK